jgi:hypothetical protein
VVAGANSADSKAIGNPAYSAFLSELQAAVRASDRSAVIALIQFPLRVNTGTGARYYSDERAVERDFDQIFTGKVKRAIFRQRADQLFVRDEGAMIGSGEVWISESCRNAACSPQSPVKIIAINP